MTFTFTLDAFPDYTKFKKTKKVLAALQVITEAVDTADEQREACVPVNIEGKQGLNVTFDDIGTTDFVKATVDGNNFDGRKPGNAYEQEVFGDLSSKGQFAQVTLFFNGLNENDAPYTIVQKNPALLTAYPEDFPEGIKTREDYAFGELEQEGYDLLLGEKAGPITVQIKDKNGRLVQTIKITNKVFFVKRSRITILDPEKKLDPTTYAVNEITKKVTAFNDVISGDTICFKAKADVEVSSVKANGKNIDVDATGFYKIPIHGDTSVVVS